MGELVFIPPVRTVDGFVLDGFDAVRREGPARDVGVEEDEVPNPVLLVPLVLRKRGLRVGAA